MTSQLPGFWCLFLSCQQQKNTKNRAAVTSLRSFLFCDDFSLLFNIQNGRDIFLITEMRVNFEVNTILKIEIFGYIWLEIVS